LREAIILILMNRVIEFRYVVHIKMVAAAARCSHLALEI